MGMLESVLLVLHLLVAICVCGFVLLQHGKGADMGAAFGSGASGSLFGSAGSANFLSRTTAILAAVFFLTSLGLTWYATSRTGPKSVIQQGVMGEVPAQKAADTPPAPTGSTPAQPVEPSKAAPATPAPAGPPGSKSGDIPK